MLRASDLISAGSRQEAINALRDAFTAKAASRVLRGKALFMLGQLHEVHDGVSTEWPQAVSYYNRSAALGNADAQAALAFLYDTGKGGLAVNAPLALLHYTFASQHSDAAMMALGFKFYHGHGVRENCELSYNLYKQVAWKVVQEILDTGLKTSLQLLRLEDEATSANDRQREQRDVVEFYQYNADNGDIRAKVTVGILYLQGGYGVVRDFSRAFDVFKDAANTGDALATAYLGMMYRRGYGTQQDNETAVRLFARSASMNSPLGHLLLGQSFLEDGTEPKTERDYGQAFAHFHKAAQLKSPEAHLQLGRMFYEGDRGIARDLPKALEHFTHGAHEGNLAAHYYLALMQHDGASVLEPTCKRAVQLLKRVAERGDWSLAIDEAFSLHRSGRVAEALVVYERFAEQGYEVAQANAAYIYEQWAATPSNNTASYLARALRYHRMSAEQTNADSYLKAGDAYYYGHGTPVDETKAASFYQAASNMRHAQAAFNLGYMHQFGRGLPRDFHLAKRFYDFSAEYAADAYIPSMLAVAGLFLHRAVTRLRESEPSDLVAEAWAWLWPDAVAAQPIEVGDVANAASPESVLLGALVLLLLCGLTLRHRLRAAAVPAAAP